MIPWVEWLVSNAIVAAAMATAILVAGRYIRGAPLRHALWLLVVVKLVTPPVLPLPVLPLPAVPAPTVAAEPVRDDSILASLPKTMKSEFSDAFEADPADGAIYATYWAAADPAGEAAAEPAPARAEPAGVFAVVAAWVPAVAMIALSIWFVGVGGWLVLFVGRLVRFARVLRATPRAPQSIVTEIRRLGRRLGLRRVPEVRITEERLPPLIWALPGRRVLVLPAALLARLDDEERETLLAHELAHLARRDHWVRWLEAAAICLYWWNPVARLARRRLQDAEEQCCDAVVLSEFPERRRSYASVLMRTVEFLSDPSPHLPAAASGFGQVNVLRRRFEMILNERMPRKMSVASQILVGAAACVLPFTPVFARAAALPPSDANKDATLVAQSHDEGQKPAKSKKKMRKVERKAEAGEDGVFRFYNDSQGGGGASDGDVRAEVIVVGPDGEVKRFGSGHGGAGHGYKVYTGKKGQAGGKAKVKSSGKVVIVGPDGEMKEYSFGDGHEGHESHEGHTGQHRVKVWRGESGDDDAPQAFTFRWHAEGDDESEAGTHARPRRFVVKSGKGGDGGQPHVYQWHGDAGDGEAHAFQWRAEAGDGEPRIYRWRAKSGGEDAECEGDAEGDDDGVRVMKLPGGAKLNIHKIIGDAMKEAGVEHGQMLKGMHKSLKIEIPEIKVDLGDMLKGLKGLEGLESLGDLGELDVRVEIDTGDAEDGTAVKPRVRIIRPDGKEIEAGQQPRKLRSKTPGALKLEKLPEHIQKMIHSHLGGHGEPKVRKLRSYSHETSSEESDDAEGGDNPAEEVNDVIVVPETPRE